VSGWDKLIDKIARGGADANIAFGELCGLLRAMGFHERIRGDHHIFSRADVEEIVNLQPRGNLAKPYQVKQVRELILRYGLRGFHV